MKNFILSTLLFVGTSIPLEAQIIFKQPLSPRNASYTMNVTLDVNKKQIHGHEILTWRNITQKPTQELQFHLYMNAFKNTLSSHLKENGGFAGKLADKRAWGWIDVHSLKLAGGPDLTDHFEFIHPDDDNEDDQTVAKVVLPRPVYPGQTIDIEIEFTTQLPYVYRRNGYYKDFFFAAQWFPKIGVLENGVWNCHQYHLNTEFFSDYGVYDVHITLPETYIVGATGLLLSTEASDSLKILHFHAEDVHDFTWTAWPNFQIAKETHNGVEITLLYDTDHAASVQRTMVAMKYALDFLGDWLEPYPYPNITVIHPPTGCMNVAGMEYPTLITAGAFWPNPNGLRATEMVTIHEFSHNYWYGMVGNNEFEEAWLDEGINSYTEAKIMDHYYGDETSMIEFDWIRMGELAQQRAAYIGMTRWDRILRNAWTYLGGGYGTFSYTKPSLMLQTLENILGQETMNRIMKTYFQRWKFKHPHSQDFINVVNEVTRKNYDWYFDQLLKGSYELDYRIRSVSTKKVADPKGVFERDGGKITLPEENEGDAPEPDSTEIAVDKKAESTSADSDSTQEKEPDYYKSIVRVQRMGEVIMPVEVLLVFENGDSLRHIWNGKERWMRYEYVKPAKLIHAQVDPDRKLVLDKDFANNSRTVEPRKKPIQAISARLFFLFETALHLIGFFG